jgi:hypothetical protein
MLVLLVSFIERVSGTDSFPVRLQRRLDSESWGGYIILKYISSTGEFINARQRD